MYSERKNTGVHTYVGKLDDCILCEEYDKANFPAC